MNKKVAIAFALVIIAGSAAFGVARMAKNKTTDQTAKDTPATNTTTPSTTNQTGTNTPPQDNGTTITYDGNGFSPSTLTIKSGTPIIIKNTSSRILQFDSDPHPAHTDDPELNIGMVAAGSQKTLTLTQTGTHGYHNHLNSSQTGTIIVE